MIAIITNPLPTSVLEAQRVDIPSLLWPLTRIDRQLFSNPKHCSRVPTANDWPIICETIDINPKCLKQSHRLLVWTLRPTNPKLLLLNWCYDSSDASDGTDRRGHSMRYCLAIGVECHRWHHWHHCMTLMSGKAFQSLPIMIFNIVLVISDRRHHWWRTGIRGFEGMAMARERSQGAQQTTHCFWFEEVMADVCDLVI